MPDPHHRLAVIRHAKAEQTAVNDFERELTGRGQRGCRRRRRVVGPASV